MEPAHGHMVQYPTESISPSGSSVVGMGTETCVMDGGGSPQGSGLILDPVSQNAGMASSSHHLPATFSSAVQLEKAGLSTGDLHVVDSDFLAGRASSAFLPVESQVSLSSTRGPPRRVGDWEQGTGMDTLEEEGKGGGGGGGGEGGGGEGGGGEEEGERSDSMTSEADGGRDKVGKEGEVTCSEANFPSSDGLAT